MKKILAPMFILAVTSFASGATLDDLYRDDQQICYVVFNSDNSPSYACQKSLHYILENVIKRDRVQALEQLVKKDCREKKYY